MKTVRDILREKGDTVYSVPPGATVYEALTLMADKNIGGLVVLENDKIIGLVSERDYARKIILKGKHSQDTPVYEIMATHVLTVGQDKDIEKCMELMTDHRVRHLPVVTEEKLSGIISIGDIVKEIITHKEYIIEQLENYIKGWR
jgi:CBS domain-containing protein